MIPQLQSFFRFFIDFSDEELEAVRDFFRPRKLKKENIYVNLAKLPLRQGLSWKVVLGFTIQSKAKKVHAF